MQRKAKPAELLGLTPASAASASWRLDCDVAPTSSGYDVTGPYVQGRPTERFIYLSWGEVGSEGEFAMFRRAKLWLDAIPKPTMATALESGVLVGRLGLTDAKGNPRCASVRPPDIEWFAANS